MSSCPIRNEFELFEEVRRLVMRAEEGDVRREVVDLLFDAGEKIMTEITRVQRTQQQQHSDDHPGAEDTCYEKRHNPRFRTDVQGTVIIDNERIPVELIDLGSKGFGVFIKRPVPASSYLLLEVDSLNGIETFSCLVMFCRERNDGYRLGLRLFALLPHTS
ncbi:MAG: PilZ domain-containing protein [Magnetococcales bacterium]|nr:PilZ domain-containing protein [Magnetococcales bacterium]